MADLRPLGSEKLQGMDKINRILEIAKYKEPSQSINESKSEYTIQLSDGNYYGIVFERNGYIVKKGINESELDYMDVIENRKYHKSYSQAMKKINLLASELNRLNEHSENINLIGEQKKFVLKTPETAPAPEPAPEAGMSDMGSDLPPLPEPEGGEDDSLDMDLGAPEDEGMDLGLEDEPTAEGDDEDVTFKIIQKLTGKLGQKLRTLEEREGLTSENIKYVLNSIISAVDLEKLEEEDKDDILANFEEEIDYDDMEGDLDLGGEDEMDLDMDMDVEEEPVADEELAEGGIDTVLDEVFAESKVEKVLEKYFTITEEEMKETESKNIKKFITEKVQKVKVKSEIKEMSETFEQELTSEFLMKENKNTKFLGKTNKNNLVFEIDGKQLKVSPNGELL